MSSPGGFAYPGAPEPQGHPGSYSPQSPGGGQPITPGSITYTTSTGPDGKVIYHPFRAVPASYQTPNGKVTGIQWVPAEATQMLPTGAQPATAEFAASWNRGQLNREDERALRQWQHDEDKRRRKEEKHSAKRVAQYERERREREEEQEIRGGYPTVSRRKSFVGNPGPPAGGGYANGYPTSPGGYTPSATSDLTDRFGGMGIDGRGPGQGGYNRSSTYGPPPEAIVAPTAGLARPRKYSVGDQDRRRSMYGGSTSPYPGAGPDSSAYPHPSGYPQSAAYPVAPAPQAGGIYGAGEPGYAGPGGAGAGYSSSYTPAGGEPYPRAASPYARAASPYARAASPYGPRAPSPYAAGPPGGGAYAAPRSRAPSPVGGGTYPRGPISRAASPVGGGGAYPRGPISRAPSPNPGGPSPYGAPNPAFPQPGIGYGGGPSPNIGGTASLGSGNYGAAQQPEQLAAPPGFSRPINATQSYNPFDTIKIQDMDDLLTNTPKMPLVLQPHDVYHDDWIRLMQDLTLAWTGKLPVPEFSRGPPPKRQTLTADLVDLWNSSFFLARGVELVLYKGAERRSGPNAGTIDRHIKAFDVDDSYSDDSSTDSDSDSDSSDDDPPRPGYGGEYGGYGRQAGGQMDYEERRRQKERKKEKKRRHKEKKARKKAKARAKKYAVYLTYVPRAAMGMSPAMGMGGGMPGAY